MNPLLSATSVAFAPRASSVPSLAERIAVLAENSLMREVCTWPKPGLVSHIDKGSHTDMDVDTFRRSATALQPFFAELVEAGIHDRDMAALRKIGLRAEHAMLVATGGINTHRGAIFGMGLMCAAVGLRAGGIVDTTMPLGKVIAKRWGRELTHGPRLSSSHGEIVARRYGTGGAREEAALGFPSVYALGLSALRDSATHGIGDVQAQRVQACFALIAKLQDTNLLHRGGVDGLRFAQQSAQAFLDRGGVAQRDWLTQAERVHRAFVARGLSPGGAADLLAISLFVNEIEHGALR